jgi:hypothetical protein
MKNSNGIMDLKGLVSALFFIPLLQSKNARLFFIDEKDENPSYS